MCKSEHSFIFIMQLSELKFMIITKYSIGTLGAKLSHANRIFFIANKFMIINAY